MRTQLPVDGYIRVSRVGHRRGERFISPTVQQEQIEAWAASHEVRLLEVFVELDQSGGRAQRPLLEVAIGRVESGISRGIVVAKLDRLGRSLIDGLKAIERISAAGGTFYSIQDGLDLSTDSGRLVLRILLSMAEWELERNREMWATAQAKAIQRGVFTGPHPPAGYRRTRSGRLRPDPATADAVSEAFRRRASGDSVGGVGRFLEARGVLTPCGNPGWSNTTTQRLLHNRVYLGEVHCGQHVRKGAHVALVDPATWQIAQEPRQLALPGNRRPALLTGLVRCAGCSMRMMPYRLSGDRAGLYYVCKKRFASGRCEEPTAVLAAWLESQVEEIAFGILSRRRRAPKGSGRRS
jgi:DNA invertase Pin-like site-specific DNA recombinase